MKTKKMTQKVSRYEKEEADMSLARTIDNALAFGSAITIYVIGKKFCWYDFYITNKIIEAVLFLCFWRLPFLGLFAIIKPRERKHWINAVWSYVLPKYLQTCDPEEIKETAK